MSDAIPQNPPWAEDKTVADGLLTAADFLGSDKTREHTLMNLQKSRRVIYTVEFFKHRDGTVNMILLVNAANTIVTRNGLLIDEAALAPTPAETLSTSRA